MNTKLTDFTELELRCILKGILNRIDTLRNLINEVNKFEDLKKLHDDWIPGYKSEIESLVLVAAKINTAIEYVKDKKTAVQTNVYAKISPNGNTSIYDTSKNK